MTNIDKQRSVTTHTELVWAQRLPQKILAFLPLTLFFQVGLMYAGLILFLLSWSMSGQWRFKWQRLRQSPLFLPVACLSVLTVLSSMIHPHPEGEFSSSFLHYQSYWILIPMLTVGGGDWQRLAVRNFFIGAVIAAILFYMNSLGLLPDTRFFRGYIVYEGAKSILFALLLAIASAWMLHDWFVSRNAHFLRAFTFVLVLSALLLFARSRTASLLFLILCLLLSGIWASGSPRYRKLYFLTLITLISSAFVTLFYIAQMKTPITCHPKVMLDKYSMSGAEILKNRSICTVHQVRDYLRNGQVTEDGMRLEIYQNTWSMIKLSPWLGHGIGNWRPMYREKAQGMMSEEMITPHNDYLLYWFELGIGGVLCLLAIWSAQLKLGFSNLKYGFKVHAITMIMLTVSIMFSASLNAIMRDGVYTFAMLILLAIPLASLNLELSWREKNKIID